MLFFGRWNPRVTVAAHKRDSFSFSIKDRNGKMQHEAEATCFGWCVGCINSDSQVLWVRTSLANALSEYILVRNIVCEGESSNEREGLTCKRTQLDSWFRSEVILHRKVINVISHNARQSLVLIFKLCDENVA